MTSSPVTPRIAAPRISLVSASTITFMKPWVSPFSTARATRAIGRVATNALRPDAFTWASVMPARPSGGSMNSAAAGRHRADCGQRVGSDYLPARIGTGQADSDAVALVVCCHAFRVQAEQDAFSFEDVLYCLGNIFILARDEARAFLNDGDVG